MMIKMIGYIACVKKGAHTLPVMRKAVPPIEIYKHFSKENYCTTIYRTLGEEKAPILLCEEELPLFNWQMHTDRREILGYTCTMATTTFRGRDYEAWFAPQVPLFEGPWKFSGLPGLIMFIRDTEDQYVFECIGIRQTPEKSAIKLWDFPYKKVTHEEYMKTLQSMHKHPALWLKNTGNGGLRYRNGKEATDVTFPFNELELE